jgi:hypothetical protein
LSNVWNLMSRSSNEIIRSRHGGCRYEQHARLRYRARFADDTLLLLPIFFQASQRVLNVKALACEREVGVNLLRFQAVVGA